MTTTEELMKDFDKLSVMIDKVKGERDRLLKVITLIRRLIVDELEIIYENSNSRDGSAEPERTTPEIPPSHGVQKTP
jgi:hypothetical protein